MMSFESAVKRAKKLLGKEGSVGIEYNCNGVPNSTWYCVGRRDGDAVYHTFVPMARGSSYEEAFVNLERLLSESQTVTAKVVG